MCFFRIFLICLNFVFLFSGNSIAVTKNWCVSGNEWFNRTHHQPLPSTSTGNFNVCPKKWKRVSFEKVKKHFSIGPGKSFLCSLLEGNDFSNERLKTYYQLAVEINLKCKPNENFKNKKIAINQKENQPNDFLDNIKKQKLLEEKIGDNWCFGSDTGYQEGSHPLPGTTSIFNPCPGKYLKKISFEKVITHFLSPIGKKHICNMIKGETVLNEQVSKYIYLSQYLNLSCNEKNNIVKNKPNKENIINSEELKKERQKRIELEKKLAALEKKTENKISVEDETSKSLAEEEKQKRLKEEQKRKELEKKLAILSKKKNVNIDNLVDDNTAPVISAQSKQDGFYATISGTITDDVKLAEVLIDNKLVTPNKDGSFNTKLYVPRNGLEVKILAFDMKGNKASKTLKVERGAIEEASGPVFASLDPSAKKVKSNPDALALIVGVADYEKTNADAIYADKDAQQFYDYARMKLGIPAKNIKELVNNKADLGEIALAVQDWVARSTKQGKTDVYIYFAGHGLASDDGKDMYLLPYDGRPRLLNKTALLRDELFADIKKANPRSVTVFLDTCYSGTTRGTDMLIASRPIAIRALEQSIPNNFTVFSAAAGDQTSKPLEEAKHGMFSYFLMKGMEGDADTNNDNKITAQELHNYVKENVTQQSSGSQTPELQGDKDRVLVQFN